MNKLSGAETASALCDPPPMSVRCAASGKRREDRGATRLSAGRMVGIWPRLTQKKKKIKIKRQEKLPGLEAETTVQGGFEGLLLLV